MAHGAWRQATTASSSPLSPRKFSRGSVGYLPMAIAGFLEEARAAAARTFISTADAGVAMKVPVGYLRQASRTRKLRGI